jgi:hypothetical protein
VILGIGVWVVSRRPRYVTDWLVGAHSMQLSNNHNACSVNKNNVLIYEARDGTS